MIRLTALKGRANFLTHCLVHAAVRGNGIKSLSTKHGVQELVDRAVGSAPDVHAKPVEGRTRISLKEHLEAFEPRARKACRRPEIYGLRVSTCT